MNRVRLITFAFLFLIVSLKGQTGENSFSAGLRLHSGLNLPVYKALDYLVTADVFAFDIYLGHRPAGSNYWDDAWNFPETGIGYSFGSLGNKYVLGNAHSLYSSFRLPLAPREKKITAGIRASAGVAFLPKSFDLKGNHLNRAIGSHINIFMRLGVDCYIRVYNNIDLILEADATHYSNGKTSSPNYGINIASLAAGLNYRFSRPVTTPVASENLPEVKKFLYTIHVSAGPKAYDNLNGNRYLSSTFSFNAGRYISRTGRAGLGADLFFDGSIREALGEQDAENDVKKLFRFGVHGSYSLRYKRTIAGLKLGYYLYSRHRVITDLYSIISLQYILTEKISAGAFLRSHFGKADALEYGIGYTW